MEATLFATSERMAVDGSPSASCLVLSVDWVINDSSFTREWSCHGAWIVDIEPWKEARAWRNNGLSKRVRDCHSGKEGVVSTGVRWRSIGGYDGERAAVSM